MSHCTEGSKIYTIPVGGLIANVHVCISVMREGFKHKKLKRSVQIERAQECFPSLKDLAAIENLLDGFYLVAKDGSVEVDNVPWGRR